VVLRLYYNTEIVGTVSGRDYKENRDGKLKGLVAEIKAKVWIFKRLRVIEIKIKA
jgi:hypothetical protein